jgi:hypothetical protein
MKLLFAKDGADASDELKELLGFIDADIKFNKIKPDVITATNDIVDLIGQEMYDSIHTAYLDSDSELEHLVYLTKYPIAILAYSLLAPNMDISHTNNGRKMRQDDNEKQAFQWMLDSDNEALQKRYYRAVDDLLKHLDTLGEWKDMQAYKKLNKLFITSTSEFNEYFMIGSRLILMKLVPGISQCESREILPRIGRAKFDDLKSKLQSGTDIENEEDVQLLSLIREACAYYSLSWAMIRLSVTIFPEGVLQAYTSDRDTTQVKQPAAKMEPQAARQAFMQDASDALLRIEKLVAPVPVANCNEPLLPQIITGPNFLST